jgi:hypothetical protein
MISAAYRDLADLAGFELLTGIAQDQGYFVIDRIAGGQAVFDRSRLVDEVKPVVAHLGGAQAIEEQAVVRKVCSKEVNIPSGHRLGSQCNESDLGKALMPGQGFQEVTEGSWNPIKDRDRAIGEPLG